MNILIYFIYTTIGILLVYNFLTTVLFCFKKELLSNHKNILITQQLLLVAQFFALIVYLYKVENSTTDMFLICWIWGFLTSHLFIHRKKRLLHELLGLGILLAITIVLYFKQEDIILTITQQELKTIGVEIAIIYVLSGLFLGAIFWPKNSA